MDKLYGKKVKMIFSDIDGTLLTSDQQVTPATSSMLRRLEKEGVFFVLASARMPEGMWSIQAQAGISGPMICYSGALILDGERRVLASHPLNLSHARQIKALLDREFADVCCNIYGGSHWIVDDDSNPWVRQEEQITALKAKKADPWEIFGEKEGIHKILLMGEADRILEAEKRIGQMDLGLFVARSSTHYLEIMEKGIQKAQAVRFLCEYYHVDLSEAIAFGDGENDMGMLSAVPCSFAMGNASDRVKESAAYVALDNDHEGLLEALKHYF